MQRTLPSQLPALFQIKGKIFRLTPLAVVL
jgi:hypothetical protein